MIINNNNNILVEFTELFFRAVVLFSVFLLAACIGAFIKRNDEFYYPVIFGLVYGNYLSIIWLIENRDKYS